MASPKPDAPDDLPGNRRQPPTIDLKATDVTPEQPGEPQGSDREPQEASSPAARDTAAVAARLARLVAASAVGALVMAAILGGIWLVAGGDETTAPRLQSLERQVRDLAARPRDAAVTALEARVVAAEQAQAAAKVQADKLAAVEQAIQGLSRPATPDAALAQRLAAVEALARDLGGQLADARARSEDAQALARSAFSRSDSGGVAAAASDAAMEREIAALNTRIGQIEQAQKTLQDAVAKMAGAATGDRAMRAAFLVSALRAAVERGGPFSQELEAARPYVGETTAFAVLTPLASSGVVSLAALRAEFTKIDPRIDAALPQEGGLFDKLQAKAERLVRVRPVDARPGDDVASVMSRIHGHLTRGDTAAAMADADKLPAEARDVAGGWLQLLKSRQAALDAARTLEADALRALGAAR